MFRVAPSVSRLIAPATVTTPELLLIAKRPPSLSNKLYVMLLVVASASIANVVSPTVVPTLAFSTTEFTAATESVTALVANSLTSPMLIVNVWIEKDVSVEVARTVML